MFQKYGVEVVLSGHEHVYERIAPQKGINYFVLGSSGELRYHDLRPSPFMVKGFDTDNTFGMMELSGKNLSYQIVSRTGDTVDSRKHISLLLKCCVTVSVIVFSLPRINYPQDTAWKPRVYSGGALCPHKPIADLSRNSPQTHAFRSRTETARPAIHSAQPPEPRRPSADSRTFQSRP